jgi:hypothetical protein
MSRCHFDANLYSEPIAVMNLMFDFEHVKNQQSFVRTFCLSLPRLRRLLATRNSLRNRVADFIGVEASALKCAIPPTKMAHAKLTILRVIQVWCFHESLIESFQICNPAGKTFPVRLSKMKVSEAQLLQVLDANRHEFVLVSNREVEQVGRFSLLDDRDFSNGAFVDGFERRFVSYGLEKGANIMWYESDGFFTLLVPSFVTTSVSFETMKNDLLVGFKESTLYMKKLTGDRLRGRKERSAGIWEESGDPSRDRVQVLRWTTTRSKKASTLGTALRLTALQQLEDVYMIMSCVFSLSRGTKKNNATPCFNITSRGQCCELSKQDLVDVLGTPNIDYKTNERGKSNQEALFTLNRNSPMHYDGKRNADLSSDRIDVMEYSSWNQPLIHDIPEGARLLSVLASARRKEHAILLSIEKNGDKEANGPNEEPFVHVGLDRAETRISERWKRFGIDRQVFVNENCVPAAALSIDGATQLYACCANTLELKGGGLKVECLTILPPGHLFILLSHLTFGLQPFPFSSDDKDLASESLKWLIQKSSSVAAAAAGVGKEHDASSLRPYFAEKIALAIAFRRSCCHMGENLKCFPEKVVELLRIFDKVDGYQSTPWDDLDENPFVTSRPGTAHSDKVRIQRMLPSNGSRIEPKSPKEVVKVNGSPTTVTNGNELRQHTTAKRVPSKNGLRDTGAPQAANVIDKPRAKATLLPAHATMGPKISQPAETRVAEFPSDDADESANRSKRLQVVMTDLSSRQIQQRAAGLFKTELVPGETVKVTDFPSTNILCLLIREYCNTILERKGMAGYGTQIALDATVSLDERHWMVFRAKIGPKQKWRYFADFVGRTAPLLPTAGRSNPLTVPPWIEHCRARPPTITEAFACIPPQCATMTHWEEEVVLPGSSSPELVVFFNSIETALRMGAAFWLERQFYDGQRHWYQMPLDEMIAKATL